jgi:teichuronic acid exporter
MGDQKLSSTSMLSALGLQLISKYANVAVQLVVSMILARILTPGEYGTVANWV